MDSCIRLAANKAQIKKCKEKVGLLSASFEALSQILDLAGNEVRLKILFLIDEENELCPCDLSDILGMSIPAISQHLRKLKDGNVVKSRKDGQTIYYSIKDDQMNILKPFLKHINPQGKIAMNIE